jgi:hypothetical protein
MKNKFIANSYSIQFGCQGVYITQNDREMEFNHIRFGWMNPSLVSILLYVDLKSEMRKQNPLSWESTNLNPTFMPIPTRANV